MNDFSDEFLDHLLDRGAIKAGFKDGVQKFRPGMLSPLLFHRKAWLDPEEELVTFPLWTVTGQLVGYQRYNWRADKFKNNDPKGRYWTYRRKDILSVWGLDHTHLLDTRPLFVVEGIWDAVSIMNTGNRCVAVLTNNPKELRTWLACLPCKTVAVCDGDKAGMKLAKSCDDAIVLPEGEDANSMDIENLKTLLEEVL